MTKIQQDVLIYKEKTFTTAQKQFEKDLRKRQGEGWRLVSVTPTERKGFGRIVQLTAIYERDVIESSEIPVSEPHPIKANEDTILTQEVENSTKENGGMWEKLKESNRRAIEREHAYQSTLNPEQLRKRKRRNLLISSITLLVALTLCIGVVWAAASNPDSQSIDNTANTSTTVIQTVKPTTTPKPTNTPTATPKPAPTETAAQIEAAYKASTINTTVTKLDKDGIADQGKDVHFTCTILNFVKDSTGTTAGANVSTEDSTSIIQVAFTSGTDITRLNEGDTLEVWGTDQGVFSGTNAFGGTVQEVGITANYMYDQTTNYQANS